MEQNILQDLFCFLCSLQFDKKAIYDMHVKIIHGWEIKIKQEPKDENQQSLKDTLKQDSISHEVEN